MNYFKWLSGFMAVLALLFGVFLFYMRFHDGPIQIFSGGAFKTGKLQTGLEPDWNEIKDRGTIQIQSITPARSRITWLAVIDGKIYTPSGYMNSRIGKMWKRWPVEAQRDGRALLRIDGRIYERQLVRLPTDSEVIPPIIDELNRKYGARGSIEDVKANGTWLFELAPRG